MARLSGKDADFTLNSVAIEDELDSIDLKIDVDLPEITAFNDSAKTHVEGKYGWTMSVSGSADFAASQGDATLFAMLGAGSVTSSYEPVGGTVGASAPNYQGSTFLKSYSVSNKVGEAVKYQAELQGSGALSRLTS